VRENLKREREYYKSYIAALEKELELPDEKLRDPYEIQKAWRQSVGLE
jgi:hypothetical protein